MNKKYFFSLLALCLSLSPLLMAAEESSPFLTGNWGGGRSSLSEKGLDLNVVYKGEVNRNMKGGLRSKTVFLDNLDLKFSFDFEKMIHWEGASGFIYFLGNHGGKPTGEQVGDAQYVSNIEIPQKASFKLYEAWLQQKFLKGQFSVLAGLHDLNSEFYSTDSSLLFFNSSFGVGKELSQTGANGPSIFPTTAPAIRFKMDLSSVYLQTGLWNAQAGIPGAGGTHLRLNIHDGALFISELGYISPHPAKYALGVWTYSKTQTPSFLTELRTSMTGNNGAYILLDQGISDTFSTFVRYGVAASKVNNFDTCLGVGLVSKGLLKKEDRWGIAVARVTAGNEYREANKANNIILSKAETTFEMNYRLEAGRGVALQPSFQWVTHPGLNPDLQTAKVIATRLEVSF